MVSTKPCNRRQAASIIMFPSQDTNQQPPFFPSAPGSPTSPSQKRYIFHEDRDMHEIKRRMGGLRFGEESAVGSPAAKSMPATATPPPILGSTTSGVTPAVDAAAFPSPFSDSNSTIFRPHATPGGVGITLHIPPTVRIPDSAATSNSTSWSAVSAIPSTVSTNEVKAVAIDSDDNGGPGEEEGRNCPQSGSISRTSSTSSTDSVSRIDDDIHAVMPCLLYKRPPPRDKVEARIENLIRYSLLGANPEVTRPPTEQPLYLCDKPWPVVEETRNNDQRMDGLPVLRDEGDMEF